jgi:DNA primase
MAIPDHIIDEIRERADLVEVIGEVVALKKRGKNFVGLCPFHPEKTPSFSVSPDKQMYYCFGCQAGGNVFSFLIEHEKLDFPDAVRELGERTGVEVPDRETVADDPNAPLYHVNRLAAEFYHRYLMESPDAEIARGYLSERRIEREAWETFLLGWAPDEWEALTGEASRQGIESQTLIAAGVAVRSEKTGGVYDRFRGRPCFPIRSVGGKVVALSGRRLDDEEPKYLNSSDTAIFSKGRTLFNLDLARSQIRRAGAAIIVEGNFDVVGLYQAGFRNVVAPLGTAMTSTQTRILKRYTATAYLACDGDAAGERSAFRASDLLLAAGFAVRVVSLPEGSDPDDVIRDGGADAFVALIEAGQDVIDAKLDVVRSRVDLTDVMKKRRAISRLLKSVKVVPDAMTQSLYLDKIAAGLGVPRDTLTVSSALDRTQRRAEPIHEVRPKERSQSLAEIATPGAQDERYVLLHAVNDSQWLAEAQAACRPEYFVNAGYRALFEHLTGYDADSVNIAEQAHRVSDPDLQRVIAELEVWFSANGLPLSAESFRDSLSQLLVKAIERGVNPEFEPTGERLADAVRQRDVVRAIRHGERPAS